MRKSGMFGLFVGVCLSFSVLFFGACDNSLDDMLENYNGTFSDKVGVSTTINMEKVDALEPGDPGFTGDLMLEDVYYADTMTLLELAAPYKCSSWEWVFRNREGEVVEFRTYPHTGEEDIVTSWKERTLNVYIDWSLLADEEDNVSYRLYLTVKGNDGVTYKDSSTIVIYPRLYDVQK